jgi:xanthine phosphoribosyltransferase
MTKSVSLSYEQMNQDFRTLVQKIRASGKSYDGILAIANGGLAPAYYLAKTFDLPIECVSVKSYKGSESGEISERRIEGVEKQFKHPQNILLVDDIYDSGKTVSFLQQKYPEMDTAVLCVRYSKDAEKVTFFSHILDHQKWIEFPWEKDFY